MIATKPATQKFIKAEKRICRLANDNVRFHIGYTLTIKTKEVEIMIGAILGDMIGAPYEFDRSPKTKKFPLFSRVTEFTDDSVMTVAVAEALMDAAGKTDDEIRAALVYSMRK